jgi:hypothetical protein
MDDQVLSYLFMRDLNKKKDETFLEKTHKELRYLIDLKVTKIKPNYDLYIQNELLTLKNNYLSEKKKYKKISLVSEDRLGFELGPKYLIKITFKIELSQRIYQEIQNTHIGKITFNTRKT